MANPLHTYHNIDSLVRKYVKEPKGSENARKIQKELEKRVLYHGLDFDFGQQSMIDPPTPEIDLDKINQKSNRLTPGMSYSTKPLFQQPVSPMYTVPWCEELFQSRLHQGFTGKELFDLPEGVHKYLWEWIIMKQLLSDIYCLLASIQNECTPQTCKTMTVKTYTFLCACHSKVKECSAIDYSYHNLNSAVIEINNPLTSPRFGNYTKRFDQQLNEILRRLYRLFIHSYYHHKTLFLNYEKYYHGFQHFYEFVEYYKKEIKPYLKPLVTPDFIICIGFKMMKA